MSFQYKTDDGSDAVIFDSVTTSTKGVFLIAPGQKVSKWSVEGHFAQRLADETPIPLYDGWDFIGPKSRAHTAPAGFGREDIVEVEFHLPGVAEPWVARGHRAQRCHACGGIDDGWGCPHG